MVLIDVASGSVRKGTAPGNPLRCLMWSGASRIALARAGSPLGDGAGRTRPARLRPGRVAPEPERGRAHPRSRPTAAASSSRPTAAATWTSGSWRRAQVPCASSPTTRPRTGTRASRPMAGTCSGARAARATTRSGWPAPTAAARARSRATGSTPRIQPPRLRSVHRLHERPPPKGSVSGASSRRDRRPADRGRRPLVRNRAAGPLHAVRHQRKRRPTVDPCRRGRDGKSSSRSKSR